MKTWMMTAAVVVAMAGAGQAAEKASTPEDYPLALGVKLSTLGVGADLTLDLGQHFNLRGGVNWGTYERTLSLEEADLKGELRWLTVPILIDWHPAAGSFRISAGGVVNRNKISLSAEMNDDDTIELDGDSYHVERVDGEITFKDFCPYIGIGSGNATSADSPIHFSCDFGVMFQGKPEVSLDAKASRGESQDQLDAATQTEEDKLEDDMSWFQYYPVISLGFTVTF